MVYQILFTPRAQANLAKLRKRDQQVILDAIEVQLKHEPGKHSRNRKLLQENPLAPWELRVGSFRVFYDIEEERVTVVIVAIAARSTIRCTSTARRSSCEDRGPGRNNADRQTTGRHGA
jgi:mRNA-degrading endonuclease RelE of RelBE toxin-antitoxin system